MKLCKVSDIVGGEKLARPIMTSNYQELLAAGTILKTESQRLFSSALRKYL